MFICMFFFMSSFSDTWKDSDILNVGLKTPIRKVFQLNISCNFFMQLKIFNPLLDWRKRVRSLHQCLHLHLPSGLFNNKSIMYKEKMFSKIDSQVNLTRRHWKWWINRVVVFRIEFATVIPALAGNGSPFKAGISNITNKVLNKKFWILNFHSNREPLA